jgi:predicted AAA+ superfamily ATPase
MQRYCEKFILQDLQRKMVFIGGPRQVGKTTMSKEIAAHYEPHTVYFNWDNDEDRIAIRKKHWTLDTQLIIFDELHKYTRWKQWIKGVYDVKPEQQQYLVTGSARLDIYKRGGDSLMGRYHYWRLHPFTIDELPPKVSKAEGLQRLLTLGGFPEPFLLNDEREARRWRNERFNRILREDIRDLEKVRELQLLSLFTDALRERVSSTISLSNIAQDLGVSPNTTKSWLSVLKRMYICFSLTPLIRNVPRAIHKPTKVYFYNNADVIEANTTGARLENLVANTIIKRLNFIEDYHGKRCRLYYIRDKDGREVDFAVYIDGQLEDLIEVKTSNTDITTSLKYYATKLKPKRAIQIVGDLKRPFDSDGIHVTNPINYFSDPPWENINQKL